MKVLLLNGSSHQNGCTFTALNEMQKMFESEGISASIFQMGPKALRGCVGCGACSNNRCVFDDDIVNRFLEQFEGCDGLVVGTPVYFASPNGALLALLDRAFYAGGALFSHKPAAAVASARRAGTTASLDVLYKYFTIKNMPIVGSQYWPMVHGNKPEDVKQDLEGMQTMRMLAKNMSWLMKCIAVSAQNGIEIPKLNEEREWTNFIR